ncbi:MAG: HD domain-containing phosphohydrolase [Thermoanaerobaculia bacterium]
MHPDIQELQSKLKEILYDCAVEIRATKAALYLWDGDERYEMVTQFGFRGGLRAVADRNDPVIDRSGRGRTAFFVNGLSVEPRFSELLYEASTDRLLVAPIYLRGQLVGVVDMRDKGNKQPFENDDLQKGQKIADRIVALFGNKNVFGQRFITLSDTPTSGGAVVMAGSPHNSPPAAAAPALAAPKVAAPPPPPPTPMVAEWPPMMEIAVPKAPPSAVAPPPSSAPTISMPSAHSHLPRAATIIQEARSVAERIVAPPPPERITEVEMVAVRDMLRTILLIPTALVASFSAFGHLGGLQEVVSRSTITDEGMSFLQAKLTAWLAKRGEASTLVRTSVQQPFGLTAPPIASAQMQKVFTAPVNAGPMTGLYLTVAFSGNPDRAAHEMLAALHTQLQSTIEHSMMRSATYAMRARVGEALLEPDFNHFPELRRHSDAVVTRTEEFTRFLALPPAEAECARVVAITHDCGMRVLDYDLLYRKRNLSPEELSMLREHPSVGAALVEPLLGPETARAVLSHHERFDGRGYPNELRGEDIPVAARIVQICDAYEAMIAVDNYQPPETHERAMDIIERAAGSQFDPQLVHRFSEMMRNGR